MTRPAIARSGLLFMTLACVMAMWLGAGIAPPDARAQATRSDAMVRSVELVIDYGEDVQKVYGLVPWKPDMTVQDVLNHARGLPAPRGLAYQSNGTGERAFLTSIDGLANEGGGAERKNWIFEVNGVMGQSSFGVARVQAGDKIGWRFRTHDWSARP